MSIQPEGEDIRKAIQWVGQQRIYCPEKKLGAIVGEACIKFDLSPKDAGFLERFVRENPA
jgi:hypothetical protein